ncbi:MAG: hypothetical protein CSA70_03300 [Rhodobacterales bacterium]|nr:MAG: hypothetical protein CSA70_03300 [Rhodobacterales bacterium]
MAIGSYPSDGTWFYSKQYSSITIGGMAQTMYRGFERVRSRFIMTIAANNLAILFQLLRARLGCGAQAERAKPPKTRPSVETLRGAIITVV